MFLIQLIFCTRIVTLAGLSPNANPYNLKNVEDVKAFLFKDISRQFHIKLQQFENMIGNSSAMDYDSIHKIVNHPVHIKDISSGELSPSAFIPFCKFTAGWIGWKINAFNATLCNIFNAEILKDQLCYATDLNSLFSQNWRFHSKSYEVLREGITFYVDVNEDRQTISKDSEFMIYWDVAGKFKLCFQFSAL